MLRISVISTIALTRLAALIVAAFAAYVLFAPETVLGRAVAVPDAGLRESLRMVAALAVVGLVGLAALYAVFRHGRRNGLRYLAFVALLAPAFLFLPTLTRSPQWYVSLIIMGALVLSAISCLLPNPVQAWLDLEPQRR